MYLPKLRPILTDLKSLAIRFFCAKDFPTVEYEDVKAISNDSKKLLIDVRDPDEVKFGKIPQSINIPLDDISKALAMNENCEVFQSKYGRPKPDANTKIILYCRCGDRAFAAAETLVDLGYKNVHVYNGSWIDYVNNQ